MKSNEITRKINITIETKDIARQPFLIYFKFLIKYVLIYKIALIYKIQIILSPYFPSILNRAANLMKFNTF
jgi:hypothetical protein